MKSYVIYAFADPRDGEVRYIGASTRSGNVRLSEHRCHAWRRLPELAAWLAELDEIGHRVQVLILEREPPDGINGEKRWIAEFRDAGARLFNKSAGGQGFSGVARSAEHKRRVSQKMLGRLVSTETREKIAARKRGKARPDLAELNRGRAKLSPSQVAEIRTRLADGEKGIDLARAFDVAPSIISLIRQNKRRS